MPGDTLFPRSAPESPKKSWNAPNPKGTNNGAMKAASEGTGINRAALEYGVPKSTLKDRVAGRVQHGAKSGKTPYLSPNEEKELVDYLVTCSKIGYP